MEETLHCSFLKELSFRLTMRRLLLSVCVALLGAGTLCAQVDSLSLARMDALLDQYVSALEGENAETRNAECDFIIESCTDSLLRDQVFRRLFQHYSTSSLMGDETTAVHLYDKWVGEGKASFGSELEKLEAGIFVTFNRSSLIGIQAPVLEMTDLEGKTVSFPLKGDRMSVLFFYDTGCSKCKLESAIMKGLLEEFGMPLDFYAVYVGDNEDSWREFAADHFMPDSSQVRFVNVWDPEVKSDFQRLYGILETPRLFLTDMEGVIAGRRLTLEALKQLLGMGKAEMELYDRNPVGENLPSISVPSTMRTARKEYDKVVDLSSLKGRNLYLFFHSESCNKCKGEIAAADALFKGKRHKFVMVDMDEILALNQSLAGDLFDSFDLRVLPHIISLDKKGCVTGKYVSFKEGE